MIRIICPHWIVRAHERLVYCLMEDITMLILRRDDHQAHNASQSIAMEAYGGGGWDSRDKLALAAYGGSGGGGREKGRRVKIYDAEEDALALMEALASRPLAVDPLIDILPALSHEQMLELRSEYKRRVKV